MLLHFVDGEKGGVGKSWFCRLLVECCLHQGSEDIVLVESDSSNLDVGKYYPEITEKIFFSEDEKRSYNADSIFKLSEVKPVIVNLPAQVEAPLNDWISRNGLLEEDFSDLKIYKWFVCTGEPDSIELFKKSVTALDGKIEHVLVKNMGPTGAYEASWQRLKEDKALCDFLEKHGVISMELLPLHKKDAEIIVVGQMTFFKAIAPDSEVERLAKRRLRIYRDKVFDAIAATGLITKDIFDEHTNYDAISLTLKAADNLLAENLTSGSTNNGEAFSFESANSSTSASTVQNSDGTQEETVSHKKFKKQKHQQEALA